MIQIAYEPTFDPFHSSFRLLRQIIFRGFEKVSVRRMKVLDLYLAEPERCLDIRLSGKLKAAARKASLCQMPSYGRKNSASIVFNSMSPIQDAAIQTLVLQGILLHDAFLSGDAIRGEVLLPLKLSSRLIELNLEQEDLMNFLCGSLDEIPFDGANGLKDRTGLAEYRYDIV